MANFLFRIIGEARQKTVQLARRFVLAYGDVLSDRARLRVDTEITLIQAFAS